MKRGDGEDQETRPDPAVPALPAGHSGANLPPFAGDKFASPRNMYKQVLPGIAGTMPISKLSAVTDNPQIIGDLRSVYYWLKQLA